MPGIYSDQDKYEDGTVVWSTTRRSTNFIDHFGTDPAAVGETGIHSNVFVRLYASVIIAATGAGSIAFFWVSADNEALTSNPTILGVANNPALAAAPTAATIDIPIANLTVGLQLFNGEAAHIKQRYSGLFSDEVGAGVLSLVIRASISHGGDEHTQP